MKKIFVKSILGGLAITLPMALVSCNDYLDVTPPSEVSPESYFLSATQLKSYVDAYYANYSNW